MLDTASGEVVNRTLMHADTKCPSGHGLSELRRGPSLWSYDEQAEIAFVPLPPHASFFAREVNSGTQERCC